MSSTISPYGLNWVVVFLATTLTSLCHAEEIGDPAERSDVLKRIAAANESNYSLLRTWVAEYRCEQAYRRFVNISPDSEPLEVEVHGEEDIAFAWDVAVDCIAIKLHEDASKNRLFDLERSEIQMPDGLAERLGVSRTAIFKQGELLEFFPDFEQGPSQDHPEDPMHALQRIFPNRPEVAVSRIAQRSALTADRVRKLHHLWKLPHRFFSIGDGFIWEELEKYVKCLDGDDGPTQTDWANDNVVISLLDGGEIELEVRYRSSFASNEIGLIVTTLFDPESLMPLFCSHRNANGVEHKSMSWKQATRRDGVFIPKEYYFKLSDMNTGALVHEMSQELQSSELNETIDPKRFELDDIGLRDGDRLSDRSSGDFFVWMDGTPQQPETVPLDRMVASVVDGASRQKQSSRRWPVFAMVFAVGLVGLLVSIRIGKHRGFFE